MENRTFLSLSWYYTVGSFFRYVDQCTTWRSLLYVIVDRDWKQFCEVKSWKQLSEYWLLGFASMSLLHKSCTGHACKPKQPKLVLWPEIESCWFTKLDAFRPIRIKFYFMNECIKCVVWMKGSVWEWIRMKGW